MAPSTRKATTTLTVISLPTCIMLRGGYGADGGSNGDVGGGSRGSVESDGGGGERKVGMAAATVRQMSITDSMHAVLMSTSS